MDVEAEERMAGPEEVAVTDRDRASVKAELPADKVKASASFVLIGCQSVGADEGADGVTRGGLVLQEGESGGASHEVIHVETGLS